MMNVSVPPDVDERQLVAQGLLQAPSAAAASAAITTTPICMPPLGPPPGGHEVLPVERILGVALKLKPVRQVGREPGGHLARGRPRPATCSVSYQAP